MYNNHNNFTPKDDERDDMLISGCGHNFIDDMCDMVKIVLLITGFSVYSASDKF